MLQGISIYTSDDTWRQILTDLHATIVLTSDCADVNLDSLDIRGPLDLTELQALIFSALDNSDILTQIFGRHVVLSHLQSQIVVLLFRNGVMSSSQIKHRLGYSPMATTHVVSTAIYQLRQKFGHNFIKSVSGGYALGTT